MGNEKKIKILYVITKSNWGGAQRYVYDLATNIPKENFDVVVVLGGNGVLKEKLEEKNIKVISILGLVRDVNIFHDFKIFFNLLRIIREERPDVLHLNSSKIGGLGALAGRIMGVRKIIFTAHGWAFNEDRNFFSKKIIKLLSWFTVLLSHKTIAVSESIKMEMKCVFVGDNIVVIHNAVSSINFKDRNEARKILTDGRYLEKFWFGAISELHRNKGLKYAIDAVNLLKNSRGKKDFVFVVIGEGEERKNLEDLIIEKGLEDIFLLVGYKDNAASLLKAFDVFSLSSVKEGFPYVLLEAALAELPVISTNVGGISEIIKDKETGILVKPKNSEDIYKALLFILNNIEGANRFGENLKEKSITDFSFKRFLYKHIDEYIQ